MTALDRGHGRWHTVERWIDADDGWRLSVLDCPAQVVTASASAVAVLGHAMMVDRRTVYRPEGRCLAATLMEAGVRVLVPDLRGHGRSGPLAAMGGEWSYDDLVTDMGRYISLAQALEPGKPLFLIGNSLFGHLTLAYLGTHDDAGVTSVKGVVGFSVNIWNKRWTASLPRWWLKRAVSSASFAASAVLGRIPASRLGLGTTDEPARYWHSMQRWVPGNRWDADSGTDYAALLANVRCPLLLVLSDGDRLLCHPDDGLLYASALGAHPEVLRLGPRCHEPSLRTLRPGHVEMVSHPRCEPLWRFVAGWIHEQI